MRFASITALSLSAEVAKAVSIKQTHEPRTLVQATKDSAAVASDATKTTVTTDVHCGHKTYSDVSMAGLARPIALPPRVDLGKEPQMMIIKRGDKIPPNWYAPDFNYFNEYGTPQDKDFGQFDVAAFYGGNIKGKGLCGTDKDHYKCIEHVNSSQGLMHDIESNSCISDIMLVRHQDSTDDFDAITLKDGSELNIGANGHPSCEIYGYDCSCEPKELVPAITRKPQFDCEGYKDFGDDVPAFNAMKAANGYVDTEVPLPGGSWGYMLNLEQPNLFGHEYWDEWHFGLKIVDADSSKVKSWCPAAGVIHTNDEGDLVYEYVYALPDEEIDVGQCFTAVISDSTEMGTYKEPDFCIGNPTPVMTLSTDQILARLVFDMANKDDNHCVTQHEFELMIHEVTLEIDGDLELNPLSTDIAQVFGMCDEQHNGSGTLTWKELTTCLDSMAQPLDNDAVIRLAFQYYSSKSSHGEDYKLSEAEVIEGTNAVMDLIESFASESAAYFGHFNAAKVHNDGDDSCITLPELEEQLPKPMDPIKQCAEKYEEMYGISEYWWWKFKQPNCGFDFEAYQSCTVSGPAFDGTSLFWQTTTDSAAIRPIYVYYEDCTCKFSLDFFENTETGAFGLCEIEGHKTIGAAQELESISLRFNDAPDHSNVLNYQAGEWGPVAEHTSLRFSGVTLNDGKAWHASWLWESTDEHCAACDNDGPGYPDAGYWKEAGKVAHNEDAYYKGVDGYDTPDVYDPTQFDTTDVEAEAKANIIASQPEKEDVVVEETTNDTEVVVEETEPVVVDEDELVRLNLQVKLTWAECSDLAAANSMRLPTCDELKSTGVNTATVDTWVPVTRADGKTDDWCQIGRHTGKPNERYFSHTDTYGQAAWSFKQGEAGDTWRPNYIYAIE